MPDIRALKDVEVSKVGFYQMEKQKKVADVKNLAGRGIK